MYCSDEVNCVAEGNKFFWDFKGSSDAVDSLPLMSSPFPMFTIAGLYLLFVLKVGPEHMKSRQPYNLQNVIILYNVLQVCASAYLGYLALELMWTHGWISKTCLLETEEVRDKLIMISYYYFLAKVSEVLDTAFFILRKKFTQVTFLHVYHHAMMIVTSWSILKYEPTYPTMFIRNINSWVHVVMYTYYGLSAFPSLSKYLWWKKYITTLQLVQFTLILIHFTLTYATSECTPSYPLCLTVFWNTSFFIYLFGKFYLETYNKNKGKRNSKKENEIPNEKIKHEAINGKDSKISDLISRKKIMNGN